MNFLDLYNETAKEGVIKFLADEWVKYDQLISNARYIDKTNSVDLIKCKIISEYLEAELEKRQKKED